MRPEPSRRSMKVALPIWRMAVIRPATVTGSEDSSRPSSSSTTCCAGWLGGERGGEGGTAVVRAAPAGPGALCGVALPFPFLFLDGDGGTQVDPLVVVRLLDDLRVLD